MQLTLHTDYSLRVLVYLGLKPNALSTISEIAEFYEISRNHLVKVVNKLVNEGFVYSSRGKNGGIRLSRSAELISVGEVIRKMEPNFNIVECFSAENQECAITPICTLKNALYQGLNEFLANLDKFTLADAITPRARQQANEFPIQIVVENQKKKYTGS
ncbi:MAG: Rrf2 family transcriptional regulator [Gammaproteobacteria bacterium]|nr:Rrf2 family transcriptional regulator [Gammaproteobacteria bacterium]MDH5692328.1 Rrf2 family transcriptional regulator [Gammaproteobacteria bacterium]